MLSLHGKYGPTKAYELTFFHKIRSFSDGFTFFSLNLEYDRYLGDHKPSLLFCFVLCNYTVFELMFYDTRHVEEVL